MTDLPTIEHLLDDDDPAGAIGALLRRIRRGETVQGALRLRLLDGTEKEFTFGCNSDTERDQVLAMLRAQLATKH